MRAVGPSRYMSMAFALALFAAAPIQAARADALPDPIAGVVAKVQSAVVRIVAVRPPQRTDQEPGSDVAAVASPDRAATAIGSGFLVDPSGFIATNKHVIENALTVSVSTSEGVPYRAAVVGMTSKADIALLKIDAGKPLPAVSLGDSDKMRVGDTVIAIGSPFGFDGSVTAGIISAVNRDIMESPFDDYIQTDAPINHGNSGGPLFNLAGEVIGMNSVLFAPGMVSGSVGLGFAIPSNDLRFVFDRLKRDGRVRAGMLPIRTQQVTWPIAQAIGVPSDAGALVAALEPGSDSMMGGHVQPGDVILSFNGQKVLDPRDLARQASQAPVGSNSTLEIVHAGAHATVHVAVQAWPEAVPPVTSDAARTIGLQLEAGPRGGEPGVTVVSVDPAGTAASSGLQKGDIILRIQQDPVTGPEQALGILRAQSSSKHPYAAVLVERDKKRTWIPVAVP